MVLEEPLLVGRQVPVPVKKDQTIFQFCNPFAAAMATLGPAERYESQYMGANEFLNRRLNEEFQRALMQEYHLLQSIHLLRIYHIGTPSDRTTSEGFSKCFISWKLHQFHLIQHHLQFRLGFDPSSVCKCSTCGLQSSPGGMF